MSKFKVMVTDYAWPSLDLERQILGEVDATLLVAETGAEAELLQLAPESDAILTCWQSIPPAVLDAAPRCLHVSRYGIGLDNIPVERATELGILVTNVPDFCLEEVSDHVMALLLGSARRIVQFSRATQQGIWGAPAERPIPRLRGQTLGIIGYGNIAQALVPKALGFGLEVMAYTPRLAADALDPFGVATNELDLLLSQADYISIHVPLTAETEGLIDARALRLMKPTAYLINTSRGAVIDEAALYQALAEGWIAGAGLDVLTQEPPEAPNPLLGLDNVIATPHAAFYSETSLVELAQKAAENVAQVLRGETPVNVVNSAVMKQSNYRLKNRTNSE